ncbi:MAG TPA: DNA polymerase Y family protein [Lacunisphaera sp.]|nr:DNA polymerase Y family protein [Lacunisphaera sp.]
MFAVLHVPGFALQAVLRTDPSLARQPVALAGSDDPVVAGCTPAAQLTGVCVGQSLPQALARCPGLVIRAPSSDLEREAKAALLAAAFSVCPHVELTSPGCCTLDLAQLRPGRQQPSLQQALAELTAAGFEAAAGFAPTPLLAYYAACHAGPGDMLAGTAELLAPLPVSVAGPSEEEAAILRQWGIRTLGQLTTLSKAAITHRLGRTGLNLWERAGGGTVRPLHLMSRPQTFEAAQDCEHELESLEPLLFLFRRFVDRLALDLRNAHLAAQALELTLMLSDDTQHGHFIRLPEPVSDAGILFRALHTHLETVRTSAAITGVRLRVVPDRALVRQRGLFDGGLVDPHGFADTLARVAALVGNDRVGTPVMLDTHRPDQFKLQVPPPVLDAPGQEFSHPPRGLALRRHRPPLAATIELAGRKPAFVWTATVRGAVRRIEGPWYACGDWWEAARQWQHEEWDIELESGGLYRLARKPEGWFLEGEYD